MKDILIKSSLALAIAATGATAPAVMAAEMAAEAPGVTVSGRYRAGIVCNDVDDNDCGLENRSSRFRIAASQDLGNGMSVIGKYEFGVALDEGRLKGGLKSVSTETDDDGNVTGVTGNEDNTRRVTYVGLKGGFGEISVGSRWTPMYNFTASPVDPTNLLGGSWTDGAGFSLTDFRKGDSVNYKNSFGDAADIHVMLQMDDGDDGNDAIDEWQIGAKFNAGPATIGLVQRSVTDGDDTTGLNVSAGFGAVNVGLSYWAGEDSDAVAGTVGFGLGAGTLNLTFGQDMPDDVDGVAQPEPAGFGAEYQQKLSDNARWFVAAETTDKDDDDAEDPTRYGVGLRFDF